MAGHSHYALIVAGGTGTRVGRSLPKQLIPLGGVPIIVHTLRRFLDFDPGLVACVVLHESMLADWPAFRAANFSPGEAARIRHCAGGAERTASVYNGLLHLQGQGAARDGLVAIHDAVRPFITSELLEEAYATAVAKGNAVVCVPVKSSMRRKTAAGSEAVDRSLFYHVQTPQVFSLGEILECYEKRSGDGFTDDASLAEAAGMAIHISMGSYQNIKITTPEDLALAEMILKGA